MTKQQITVTARIKVKSGMEEKFKEEYLAVVALTVAEEGCIRYDLHQSRADSSMFMLYEQWSSKAALDQHLQMPYIKGLSEKAPNFLAEPVEILFWEQIKN
ncbi:MAG: putative quinol monooxygenase [Microcystaceae cyanobacterium]